MKEYEWNGNISQAIFNITNLHRTRLVGIAYSWGNPWLRWLQDDMKIMFEQVHYIAPVNRQKGFPYSLRQVLALLRLGNFKASKWSKEVFSYRQVNDRPAEKRVVGTNVLKPQIVFGSAKNIKKYAGKAWRFGKRTAHEISLSFEARHNNMDDNRTVHRLILERIDEITSTD